LEDQEWVTGKIKLTISGEPVEMEVTVPAGPIKPHRMLPIFQQMSSAIVDVCAQSSENLGKKISCKAGCGACCRQPVPVSEIEAYHLAELVEAMPEPRRTIIKDRFAKAFAHFSKRNWFDELIELQNLRLEDKPEFNAQKYLETVTNYFGEGIACPFLEDESCSIHPDRPLSCREYLVTSPAENCKSPTRDTIDRVPLFMRPSAALRQVGQTNNTGKNLSLVMIEALDLAARSPENYEEKTGKAWTAEFFEHLTDTPIPEDGIESPAAANPKADNLRK